MIPARSQFVFDFPEECGASSPVAFDAPLRVLRADTLDSVRATLRAAEASARDGAWVAGFVTYEAAPAFDPAFKVRTGSPLPLAWFGVFAAPLPSCPSSDTSEFFGVSAWQPDIETARFHGDIASIRDAIRFGDVYQVNHTLRMTSRFAGNDLAWFQQLRRAQTGAYAAYMNLGRYRILSLSPELFFSREGGLVTVRPMKGTSRRGRWPAEDQTLVDALYASEKNRAENLMIVDLMRNDLSRISTPHGVEVPHLFAIERYPTVLQMTSTITARTRPEASLEDVFSALFPCGSITGAPKVKAMEWIAALEASPRGAYCGAVGLIKPGGDAVFNVAIRTVVLDSQDGTAVCGVGAGITWGSDASDEYAETLLKARFLERQIAEFELIESLRFEDGGFVRLDRHLARLAASAAHLGFPFDEACCRCSLTDALAASSLQEAWVRLRLARSGEVTVDLNALPESVSQPVSFALATKPVSSELIWLFHKTSRREEYEQAAKEHPDVFDVLLHNERGEVTEFTRGNVIIELDGRMLTPLRDSGLLAGCLRAEMLDRGVIVEARLTLDDLKRATRVWFINSARGMIEMRIQPARGISKRGPEVIGEPAASEKPA